MRTSAVAASGGTQAIAVTSSAETPAQDKLRAGQPVRGPSSVSKRSEAAGPAPAQNLASQLLHLALLALAFTFGILTLAFFSFRAFLANYGSEKPSKGVWGRVERRRAELWALSQGNGRGMYCNSLARVFVLHARV